MKVIKMINEYLFLKKSVPVKPEFNELEYLESNGLSISEIHVYLSKFIYSSSSNFYINHPEMADADIKDKVSIWIQDFQKAYPMVTVTYIKDDHDEFVFTMEYKGLTSEIKCLHKGQLGKISSDKDRDVVYAEILKDKILRANTTEERFAEYLGINMRTLNLILSGKKSITEVVTFEGLDMLFGNTPGHNLSVYNNIGCCNLGGVVLRDPIMELRNFTTPPVTVWETKLGYPPSIIVNEVCEYLINNYGNGFSPELSLPPIAVHIFPEVTFKTIPRCDLTTDLYVSYKGSKMVLNIARQNSGIKYRHVSKDMKGVVQEDPVQNTAAQKSITVPLDYFTALVEIASEHGYPMSGDGYDMIEANKTK